MRVELTRSASTDNSDGSRTRNAVEMTGGLAFEPEVGKPLRVFLDNGKIVETTAVERIMQTGSKMLISTRNSLYQLIFQEPLTA